MDLSTFVRDVPDFPEPGIVFKDITPLLADAAALQAAVDAMLAPHDGEAVTKVVGIEARGFIFGAPIALALGAGFVPMRKAGKLPHTTVTESYALEYGSASLEVHADAFDRGDRVLVVDDVLATGGTARAAMALVGGAGGVVTGCAFLIELGFLGGRAALGTAHVTSVLAY